MKLFGMTAVMIACISLGAASIKNMRKRMQTLADLIIGVRRIRAELAARLCPLCDLLLLAAEGQGEEAPAFFRAAADGLDELNRKSFPEIWSAACRSCLSCLADEDLRDLEELGQTLGRYELADQLASCERYLSKTEETLDPLLRQFPERRRLSLALGAAGGFFLCLLIL